MPISVFDLSINFLESFVSVLFLSKYFRMKSSFNFIYLILWTVYITIGISIMNIFLGYEKYFLLSIPIWAYLPWLLVFANGSFLEKGYISIFVVQFHTLIITVLLVVISLIVYGTIDTSQIIQSYYEFISIASKLIFLFIGLFIAKQRRKLKSSLQVTVLVGFTAFSIVTLLIYISLEDTLYSKTVNLIDVAIALVGLLVLVLAVFLVFFKMQVTNERNLENELRIQALDYQKGLNELALEVNRETNRIQHDLKHFLSHIEFLITEDRMSEVLELIHDHSLITRAEKSVILTPYEIINYILNTKNSAALENGVSLRFVINFLNTPKINDIDLTILLGNAIDNAIENSNGRSVEVRIEDKNEYLHITISNRIPDSVLDNNKELLTTKKEKGHGYGINSIKEIAKRNEGTVTFYEKNNRFFCSILVK